MFKIGNWRLSGERILANNVIFDGEFNPHNTNLFVIGNEYGALAALWADCEQDALDEMIDNGLGSSFLTDEPNEDTSYLGNAGEACDLSNAWIEEVTLDPKQDIKLIIAFAEARGALAKSLG